MKRNDSRVRIFLLLKFLCDRTDEEHHASVPEILEFWEREGIQAGDEELYADIQALIDLGWDIISTRNAQDSYFIGSRLFELPELKLLVDAVKASRSITERKRSAMIGKLCQLAGAHSAGYLTEPETGAARGTDNEAVYYAIDTIQAAITGKRPVSFQYYGYTPGKEKVLCHGGARYVFSPFALIWDRDCYYAVGWSEHHGREARFRVDRITAIRAEDTAYRAHTPADPASCARDNFGVCPGNIRRVTLLCENSAMDSVVDRFGEDADTAPVDTAHFRAAVDAAVTPKFFAWVFASGGAVRIEDPADVLDEMKDMAKWLTE